MFLRTACTLALVCVTVSRIAAPGTAHAGAPPPVDDIRAAEGVWQGGRSPVWLDGAETLPILVYPPAEGATSPAPLLLLLHGMCGLPQNECPWFAGASSRDRFVACPRADLACPSGGFSWSGQSKIRNDLVRAFRVRVERAFPGRVSSNRAVLAGFSMGAFVGLDVAEHAVAGEWPHVMLIGARVAPSPGRLARAGVKSILFASGDWDRARPSMKDAARRFAHSKVRADFSGLGPVGHRFATDMAGWLEGAFAWLEW